MSTDFNPPCRFHDKQKIKIISGFHKGKSGIIKDCTYHRKGHGDYQMVTTQTWNEFTYIVQVRTWLWFTREVYVMERQIAPANTVFTDKEYDVKIMFLEGEVKAYKEQVKALYKRLA